MSATRYSPAGEIKLVATAETFPGSVVVFDSRSFVVAGLNGGNSYAIGEEFAAYGHCGPSYRVPEDGTAITTAAGADIGLNNSAANTPEATAVGTGDIDVTVVQAFTAGDPYVIVLVE